MFEVLRGLFRRSNPHPVLALGKSNREPITSAKPISFVFLDTETTGLNQDGTDEVLEVAIVDADGTNLLNTFVRPVRHTSWPGAEAIHGIGPSDVSTAPKWNELLPKIAALCAGKTVVFYNSEFDTRFFPPGFFPHVVCAMRRYSESHPDCPSWGKLFDVARSSGYIPTGAAHRALEDALACRHIWLIGIPALVAKYPEIVNQSIVAAVTLDSGEAIPLIFEEVCPDQLRLLTLQETSKLWTKDDREEINVYRAGTFGGRGRIASLTKADNPELARFLELGCDTTMTLTERRGNTLLFDVDAAPTRKMLLARALPKTPVNYSAIDDDIFRCFIAHQSGMCDAIGSHQEFQRVESEIARICKEKGGRYYKSKAKGAKFAIIFSPHAHTAGEIWDLQEQGYKVISFDKAVLHFGLNDLWDCQRYVAFVNSINSHTNAPE